MNSLAKEFAQAMECATSKLQLHELRTQVGYTSRSPLVLLDNRKVQPLQWHGR
jgi:hypothetical protein